MQEYIVVYLTNRQLERDRVAHIKDELRKLRSCLKGSGKARGRGKDRSQSRGRGRERSETRQGKAARSVSFSTGTWDNERRSGRKSYSQKRSPRDSDESNEKRSKSARPRESSPEHEAPRKVRHPKWGPKEWELYEQEREKMKKASVYATLEHERGAEIYRNWKETHGGSSGSRGW